MSLLKFYKENAALCKQLLVPLGVGLAAWGLHGDPTAPPPDGPFTWGSFCEAAFFGGFVYNGAKLIGKSGWWQRYTENMDGGPTWEELENKPTSKPN